MNTVSIPLLHARINSGWARVLEQLDISSQSLTATPGPCPACGCNRFTFDNMSGRGTFRCEKCGSGDALRLLMLVHGWDLSEARDRVLTVIDPSRRKPALPEGATVFTATRPLVPSHVRKLLQAARNPLQVPEVVQYLQSCQLWPLPAGCTLRAHVIPWLSGTHTRALAADVRDSERNPIPALVAEVRDSASNLTSAHVTYLQEGKPVGPERRRLLSPIADCQGCAVQLMPFARGALGVSIGIEAALAAAKRHQMPVWATLNAAMLAGFEPPPKCAELVIFTDHETDTSQAVTALGERLQGQGKFHLATDKPART